MEYQRKIDMLTPVTEKEQLDNKNYSQFMEKWLESLQEDIQAFNLYCGKINLHNLDIEPKDIPNYLDLFENWLAFIRNALIIIGERKLRLNPRLIKSTIGEMCFLIRQIDEIIITSLNDFTNVIRGKYQRRYVESISDKILAEIISINNDLLEFRAEWLIVEIKPKPVIKISTKLHSRLREIGFIYQSLIDIQRKKQKSTKLKDLFVEFELNQALSRLESTEDFFNKEIWDKAVGDMRIVLEMTVTYIVRCIIRNSNWKAPLKDGIEILLQNGIILDKPTADHFKVKKVGIYGIISIKGHHADGTSDDNLASSELEARYFISLTENVIEYLLTSFQESEFYESEE